jgi:hypothetical protein
LTSGRPLMGIKTNRGRKRWSCRDLRDLAVAYVENGDSMGLSDRRIRELMRRAEKAGIVEITRVGRRNDYRILPGSPCAEVDESGSRERDAWKRLMEFSEQLSANWQRQQQRTHRRDDAP